MVAILDGCWHTWRSSGSCNEKTTTTKQNKIATMSGQKNYGSVWDKDQTAWWLMMAKYALIIWSVSSLGRSGAFSALQPKACWNCSTRADWFIVAASLLRNQFCKHSISMFFNVLQCSKNVLWIICFSLDILYHTILQYQLSRNACSISYEGDGKSCSPKMNIIKPCDGNSPACDSLPWRCSTLLAWLQLDNLESSVAVCVQIYVWIYEYNNIRVT